jgi:ABC-type transport system involved in multi-copper enzyme maturation permease subunit
MNPTLTIAALTIKEAVRRRLLLAFLAISAVIVGLSAWGFDRLSHSHSLTSGESNLAVPDALILFMFMFSFVLALSASAIASPSISSELESGVLLTIVTRPVRRIEVVLGKCSGSPRCWPVTRPAYAPWSSRSCAGPAVSSRRTHCWWPSTCSPRARSC